MKPTLYCCSFLMVFALAAGQELPFLTEAEYQWLVNEISGDASYEHLRFLTQFHRPRGGSPGLMEAAKYVEQKAREFGLQDVRLIKQKSTTTPWSSRYGELWLVQPSVQRIASTYQTQLHLADYSRSTHSEAELVDVGRGSRESDYQGQEIQGKVVLSYGSAGEVMREAVWKRGALGLVLYPDPSVPDYPLNSLSHPDQVRWLSVPVQSDDGKPGTFAFGVSARQGVELSNLLRSGKTVRVKVDVEAEFGEEKWQVMVEGFIRGTEIDDQDIVLTAHLQEEKYSANDDGSGCANVLEIARALTRLIEEGKMQRPRRNIRFWWVTEISSERQYFADHPEAHRALLVNINQDMVGANQGQDLLRVQNLSRVPFSRFHFMNDVAERVMEFTVESNQGNLAVLQAGGAVPYPRPILSRLGTRHRFNGEIIPFHNNTDHMTFNEAPIGVPAVSLTNWPDNYIHTSDDDLWNIDRTQLQRNAFIVATIAYVLGRAGPADFDGIASEVANRGTRRMAEDFGLALRWLVEGRQHYAKGLRQIEEACLRERRAVESLKAIAETAQNFARVETLVAQLEATRSRFLDFLKTDFAAIHGSEPEPGEASPPWSEAETELQAMTPRLVAGPAEFLERRSRARGVAGLHNLMAFEVLNFVDGHRSGLQIYWAVAAEAGRAGRHYYGEVEPRMVLDYLKNLKSAELIDF